MTWAAKNLGAMIVLAAGLTAAVPRALALDPARSIAQMHHRAYTRDDGLLGAIKAIAQTPDGYIWIGATSGLYRFDGVRVEHMAADRLLSLDITALLASASGT